MRDFSATAGFLANEQLIDRVIGALQINLLGITVTTALRTFVIFSSART